MIILAVGANLAALCIPLYSFNATAATILSFFAYTLIGIGVGASGTSLLALLASHTIQHRRAAAATITWLMMIFGIAVTATVVGKLLEPYSVERLIKIVFGLTVVTVTITFISTLNIERGLPTVNKNINKSQSFLTGLKVIWANSQTKRFSVFVFLSMTAYFMQELILEPYAGIVFSFTPGQSTSLSGMQNGGVFLGMLAVGIACTGFKFGALKNWVWAGCMGSCISLGFIALAGQSPEFVPLAPLGFALGIFNGMFAVVDYVYNTGILNYVDKTRIGVTGHSAGGNAALKGASRFGKIADSTGVESKIHSVFTVSYTHLTLPTNREV